MTSLSSLSALFSAEKRCKGKHFFSFHQNFFQVFFGEAFRGGRTAARKIPPQAGKDASLSSFRGFRSRKRVQKYALYPIPQHTPHTFFALQRKLFGRGQAKEEKPHIYIYGRTRLHLFMRPNTGKFLTERKGISIRSVTYSMR